MIECSAQILGDGSVRTLNVSEHWRPEAVIEGGDILGIGNFPAVTALDAVQSGQQVRYQIFGAFDGSSSRSSNSGL